MSEEVERYFNRQQKNTADSLNTCTLAEIIKVELKYMRADIKLLLPDEPIVMQVPIAPQQTGDFIIRIPYKVGDTVVVMFSQNDIDPFLFGGGEASRRQHEADDAIIVGGIQSFNEPLPDLFLEHEEDFVIAKRDFSSRIVIRRNGEIIIESDEGVYLGSGGASEGVPLGEQLKAWLDSHTHPHAWTDPAGNSFTSPPTTPSPAPSRTVRTV